MKWLRPAAALVVTLGSLIAAEALVRAIDGYAIFSHTLRRSRSSEPSSTPDRQYLPSGVAAGVRPEWYDLDPPAPPPVTPDADAAARSAKYPTRIYEAFFNWNLAYLRDTICAGSRNFAAFDDLFTFEPAGGRIFPIYRHRAHLHAAGWFVPNNFGWRGPDITAARPPNTIRIAFVGASTTVDAYAYRFSHPELVGYWLNLWARANGLPYTIEVINAGRTGIDSPSIAAIVRDEVMSVDPDLVVFYEGANSFGPAQMLDAPKQLPARPEATFRKRSRAEDYSAIAVRAYDALLKTGQDGSEPAKPGYHIVWPPDVDEQNPDLRRPKLPMHFEKVVASLDVMREASAGTGADFAIASFVWMVDPGLQLDMSRHLTLFRYLNESYWPVTYAQMRRLMDFQNRVFKTYARQHGLVYLPMDETFPRDPDLFGDAVHMTPRGLRLRAWFYLQQIIPIIQARVAAHTWPKAPSPNAPSAAWASEPPKLISRHAILASCPATPQ